METLAQIVAQILAPLTPGLVVTALLAGIIFGIVYVFLLNIDGDDIFHLAMGGWVFIAAVFIFRLITFIGGGPAPGYAGWIGIAIIWGLYAASIALGRKLINSVQRRLHR